jgi:hypothetical protein
LAIETNVFSSTLFVFAFSPLQAVRASAAAAVARIRRMETRRFVCLTRI